MPERIAVTTNDPNFLYVKGAEIVNSMGETVLLRGFCLGGCMNMENFITGFLGRRGDTYH